MQRKRWTAKTEISDTLLKFREKRKWQIALRRYALDQNRSSFYAPYFGLDIEHFRKWIELQFDEEMNWDNFSRTWQFDHILPVVYFDFEQESDLRLCWNFINIRAEKLQIRENMDHKVDVIAAKAHFEVLFRATNYPLCLEMVQKIEKIETSQMAGNQDLSEFILQNKHRIETLGSFTTEEYISLNKGNTLEKVLAEKEFLRKFG
ncbi:MAG TPA: hypothetical protein VK543_10510 [Puia sp.]|nr:hypothetical protein [Puia sp.]